MCETANTQALQTSYVDGSQVADTPARNVEDDTKMKKLNALISRRNIINDLNVVETEPIPESMPVYSGETGMTISIDILAPLIVWSINSFSCRFSQYQRRGWMAWSNWITADTKNSSSRGAGDIAKCNEIRWHAAFCIIWWQRRINHRKDSQP